jgi:PhnB protein
MVGPNGEEHWAWADYKNIVVNKKFTGHDAFTDSEGNINKDLPQSKWEVTFTDKGELTLVEFQITYTDIAQLEATIQMGFKEGFTMALGNLDQYLNAQAKLRSQLKINKGSRVTTYLNFPGNTEEVFNFYRKVFGTEFLGNGIQRFGDLPQEAGQPPIADNVKKMVLHVELPILNGHVLMATDAPKEMGFSVIAGNNMHISLEPETREETEYLFKSLSEGGKINMPLQGMFWGSYFGSFTDRHGINWMLNFQAKK